MRVATRRAHVRSRSRCRAVWDPLVNVILLIPIFFSISGPTPPKRQSQTPSHPLFNLIAPLVFTSSSHSASVALAVALGIIAKSPGVEIQDRRCRLPPLPVDLELRPRHHLVRVAHIYSVIPFVSLEPHQNPIVIEDRSPLPPSSHCQLSPSFSRPSAGPNEISVAPSFFCTPPCTLSHCCSPVLPSQELHRRSPSTIGLYTLSSRCGMPRQ